MCQVNSDSFSLALFTLSVYRIEAEQRANFWPVLRSMPRGRRFRVPPSARRSSFDPFAVQAACAQGATLRRARSRPFRSFTVTESPDAEISSYFIVVVFFHRFLLLREHDRFTHHIGAVSG